MKSFCLVLLWVCLVPLVAFADSDSKLSVNGEPKLLFKDSTLDAAFNFDVDYHYRLIANQAVAWRRHGQFKVVGEGELATRNGFSTRPLRVDLGFEGVQLLSGPAIHGDDPDDDTGSTPAFDWGQLKLGLHYAAEKDRGGESDRTYAGRLGYLISNPAGLRWLIPSVAVQYEWVDVEKSDFRDDEGFNRWRLNASWASTDIVLPGLKAHVDLRWSWDQDQTEETISLGLDTSQYLAGGLKYIFNEPVFSFWHGLHVMVSDGRIPPVVTDETTLHLGFYVFQ